MGVQRLINACTIVLKCPKWTILFLFNVQCCQHPLTAITLHQVCGLRLRGEHSRVLSLIHMLSLWVGEAPLLRLNLVELVTSFTPKKVTVWVFSCSRRALQVKRVQGGRIRVSVAIFRSMTTQSLWMPMICLSMSFNQSVWSLIWIPWSYWGSFVPSRWVVSGHQYQRGDDLYCTWTAL